VRRTQSKLLLLLLLLTAAAAPSVHPAFVRSSVYRDRYSRMRRAATLTEHRSCVAFTGR